LDLRKDVRGRHRTGEVHKSSKAPERAHTKESAVTNKRMAVTTPGENFREEEARGKCLKGEKLL